MESTFQAMPGSSKRIWAGRIISAIPVLFLLFDGTIHIMRTAPVVAGFAQAGFPISTAVPLGIIEIACIILYVIPRTSVLGAILLTGYLGGAVATNVRQQLPMLGYVLAPVYVAVFIWGGLWLRDDRIRALVPFTRS